jgi:hypothetical protein
MFYNQKSQKRLLTKRKNQSVKTNSKALQIHCHHNLIRETHDDIRY